MAGDKKNDLEKYGVFQEFTYVNDPYPKTGVFEFNSSSSKGKQILVESNKTKSALNQGYFANFQRTFEGEAYSDPVKIRREKRKIDKDKLAGKVFHLPSISKKPEGLGSYYGTFGGPIPAMEGETMQLSKSENSNKMNFYTNWPKKGTGYGYVGVTFNKYPEYKSEPYILDKSKDDNENIKRRFHVVKSLDFFDSNPYKGTSNTGYFEKEKVSKENSYKAFHVNTARLSQPIGSLPKYETDLFNEKSKRFFPYVKNVVNDSGKTFSAIPGPKSTRTTSILTKNINKYINGQNYGAVTSVFLL